jgi:hypothetical protein
MAARDLEPYLFTPNKTYWIVAPNYDLAGKEFRVIWDDLIVKLQLGREKKVKKSINLRNGEGFIHFPWGTKVQVRSAAYPELLVGEALDGVIMSEAAKQKEETWQRFVRPGLSDRRGWASFPTTPEGQNWYHSLFQLGMNPKYPDFESWRFPSYANTAVYPGGREDPEIKLLEATTTPEWFEQEIEADFTSFVGKIFTEWDEFKNVRPHTFNPAWANYMCIDPGYTNPAAFVEFQVSPDDRIYVWREHYAPYMTNEDHIAFIKSRPNPPGYHLDLAVSDAADPELAVFISQRLVGCIANPDAKAKHMWGVGVDLMNNFMKTRPSKSVTIIDEYGTPAEDEPAYFVDPECVHHIRELNNYRSPAPVKGRNVPELGAKIEDHTIDAVRYALVQLFHFGAPHLSEVYRPAPEPTRVAHSEFRNRPTEGGIFDMNKTF